MGDKSISEIDYGVHLDFIYFFMKQCIKNNSYQIQK